MAQWFRMAVAKVAAGSIMEEASRAVSSRVVQAPVAAERIRVRRRTRTRAAMRGPHSVSHSAPAGSKTSTRRSSCRLRARLRRWSVSRGRAVAARSSRRCCRFDWFSLTWMMRSLPVALAISNVFLTGQGVDGEDAAGQAERFDQGLAGWDLVRLLRDDFMGQDDPMIDGERAQHMRRLSVRESIEAAPKRLAVDRNEARW